MFLIVICLFCFCNTLWLSKQKIIVACCIMEKKKKAYLDSICTIVSHYITITFNKETTMAGEKMQTYKLFKDLYEIQLLKSMKNNQLLIKRFRATINIMKLVIHFDKRLCSSARSSLSISSASAIK